MNCEQWNLRSKFKAVATALSFDLGKSNVRQCQDIVYGWVISHVLKRKSMVQEVYLSSKVFASVQKAVGSISKTLWKQMNNIKSHEKKNKIK